MTKTDLRLAYQKETGDNLDTINCVADSNDPDTQAYIDWLENICCQVFPVAKQVKVI